MAELAPRGLSLIVGSLSYLPWIVDGFNFDGIPIYSKGVIRKLSDDESEFYILISGKRSVQSDKELVP